VSAMPKRDEAGSAALIVETPGVCGGYPRVWNTRISVALIVEAYREAAQRLDETSRAFPQLTPEQVCAALEYYAAHPERVDEDIERNARALEAIQAECGRPGD
jgi:uncharacterized protein (DUF433 family)